MSVIRFTLPSDSTKYVDLKGEWVYGDTKAVTKARDGKTDLSGGIDAAQVLLERFIMGWNLTDEAGHTQPVGAAAIDHMTEGDVLAVVQKVFSLRPADTSPNP